MLGQIKYEDGKNQTQISKFRPLTNHSITTSKLDLITLIVTTLCGRAQLVLLYSKLDELSEEEQQQFYILQIRNDR